MSKPTLELLQGMPVFGGLRDDTLISLLSSTPVIAVSAGEYFFREGDQALSMFVLETGRVTILKASNGKEYQLNTLGAGDCFGEMALIDLFPRSASVRAIEDCTAIEISSALLYEIYKRDLEQFTLIQMNVARELSRRLRSADERLFRAIGGTSMEEPLTILT